MRFLICFILFAFIFSVSAGESRALECESEALQTELSPDAAYVSYLLKDKRRKYGLFMKSVKDGSPSLLMENACKRSTYSWSYDGQKIACTVKNKIKKNIVVIDLKSGKKDIIGNGKNPKFSPNDDKLAFLAKKDVLVYDFSTGKTENMTKNPQRGEMNSLCWGKKAKAIYYSKDGDLWKVSLNDKKNERIINHTKKSSVSPFIENPRISFDGKSIYFSLVSDGLYAHASNNLIGKYDLVSGVYGELFEANSWTLSPCADVVVYSLGPDIFIRDLSKGSARKICSGLSPSFSFDGKAFVFFKRNPNTDYKDIYIMKMQGDWSRK
jgi:Tol biopolymer transport system component